MNESVTQQELLCVESVGRDLRITIEWRSLRQAAENIPGHEIRIKHDTKFQNSVLAAPHEEEADGSTLVHRMLDEAVVFANEQGMDGFDYEEGSDIK